MRLNDLDERIVHALAEDARRSYADIGAIVGLSAPAVKRRVDRLRAEGAITGFTVRVDPAALGWETEGFIEIYCSRNTSPEAIKQGLARYPEIAAASTVTGDADAVVQVFAADMRHFEQVLERIAGSRTWSAPSPYWCSHRCCAGTRRRPRPPSQRRDPRRPWPPEQWPTSPR